MSDGVLVRGWRLLGRAIRDEPRYFTIAVGGSFVFSLATLGAAVVLGQVTSRVIEPAFESGDATIGALVLGAVAILSISVLKLGGLIARRLAGGSMQFHLFSRYRLRVADKLLRLTPRWHRAHPTGDTLAATTSDVETAFGIIAPLPFAAGTVLLIVVTFTGLLFVDWALALIALGLFISVFTINFVYAKAMAPRARAAQQAKARVASAAHESFDGAVVVKTLGAEDLEARRFGVAADELRKAQVRVGRLRGIFDPLMDAFPTVASLLVLLVGALRVRSGDMTVADVVAGTYLFSVLALPLRAIGWLLGDMARAVAGWERITGILAETAEVPYGTARLIESGPAALTIRDAAARYGDSDVLRGVTLTVHPGETLALVGPTGAGKSTLVSMVARLVEPHAGQVMLDGVGVEQLAEGELARHVAWVGQTAFVFQDTVANNVTLGAEYSDDELWAALRDAHAHEVVKALPDGLQTRIGERGATLSGGQRQRLALARALLRRPRLLLLDDATSAVDPSVEQRILANMRGRDTHASVLLVAYRVSSIALADRVAFLDEGRIVAVGSHEELLATVPRYADVVTAYERASADGRESVEVPA